LTKLAGVKIVMQQRADRIDADHFDLRILLLEEAPGAADRPAGAHPGDKDADAPAGLPPEFRAGGLVVRLGVGRVPVLAGQDSVRRLFGQPARDRIIGARIVWLDGGGRDDDSRAEGAQQANLLIAHLVGHDEDRLVTLECGGDREADAGVAARALDDRTAWPQPALALGRRDHGQPNAILDAAAGVEELDLC
jgi:hypothetical protein